MFSRPNFSNSSKRLFQQKQTNTRSLLRSDQISTRSGSRSLLKTTSKLPKTLEKNTSTISTKPKQLQLRKKGQNNQQSPSVLGTMKANLEMNTNDFDAKLKALLPPIRSLAHKYPGRGARLRQKPILQTATLPIKENGEAEMMFAPPPDLSVTEKLITIGGYIISLQPTRPDVSTVIKPRVSTDKDGLEMEIKILGCHPTEIKFEKRYDTLIVIGIVVIPLQKTAIGLQSTYYGEGVTSEGREFMKSAGYLVSKVHADNPFYQRQMMFGSKLLGPSMSEPMNDLHELVNIFVPKNISVNQVFVSKPDGKGRIFIKGP